MWKDNNKVKNVGFFYEEQHCGTVTLLLDRDEEKHLLCGTHKSSGIFVFVQHKGDPQNRMCLYTGILTEFWKSGRSLMFCQCLGLQCYKQADTSVIPPGQNNGRLVLVSEDRAKIIRCPFWCFFIVKLLFYSLLAVNPTLWSGSGNN